MKLPIKFHAPLYKAGEHNTIFFSFLNLNTVLSDSTPENLANIWQINWNWIKIDEVWNSANSPFELRFSVCCHPEILPPWQRDVTTSLVAFRGIILIFHEIPCHFYTRVSSPPGLLGSVSNHCIKQSNTETVSCRLFSKSLFLTQVWLNIAFDHYFLFKHICAARATHYIVRASNNFSFVKSVRVS